MLRIIKCLIWVEICTLVRLIIKIRDMALVLCIRNKETGFSVIGIRAKSTRETVFSKKA